MVYQFLNLNNPRPTLKELEYVSGSRRDTYYDYTDFKLTVKGGYKASRRRWGIIEDPDRPSYGKWDPEAYAELLLSEAEKRKEFMRAAIRERGLEPVDSSPDHIPWHHKPDYDKRRKGILKLGRDLEKSGIVPLREICARLVKDLSGSVDKSEIEVSCPPKWKPSVIKEVQVKE